tara:strand:- start:8505 stop:9986 length:1482 start_codon:yes stop_codon:yes gene_type:complete
MIRELLFSYLLTFGGFGTISRSKIIQQSPLLAMVILLPVGVVLFTFSSALVYIFGINYPLIGLTLMVIISLHELYKSKQNNGLTSVNQITLLCSLGLTTALLLLIRVVVSPVLTFDSYKIIISGKSFGSSIFSFESSELASFPFMVTNFQAATEIFNFSYTAYLPAVTGFLAMTGAIIIISNLVSPSRKYSFTFGVIVLMTILAFGSVTYMLRMQLGYLNSHLLMAGYYSLGFATCLLGNNSDKRTPNLYLSALLIGVVAFIRLEGMLLMTLLIISFVSINKLSRKDSAKFALFALVVPGLWYVRLAIAGASGSTIISPRNTILMLLFATSPLIINWWRQTLKVVDYLPNLTISGLGCIFCFLLLTREQTIESSLIFLTNTVGTGYWGAFWWTFGPLAMVLACVGPKIKREIVWVMTIGGGLLVILLLGAIRRIPYRIGWGDSGNRMLVHIAPLTVLYIAMKVYAWFLTGRSSATEGDKGIGTLDAPLDTNKS